MGFFVLAGFLFLNTLFQFHAANMRLLTLYESVISLFHTLLLSREYLTLVTCWLSGNAMGKRTWCTQSLYSYMQKLYFHYLPVVIEVCMQIDNGFHIKCLFCLFGHIWNDRDISFKHLISGLGLLCSQTVLILLSTLSAWYIGKNIPTELALQVSSLVHDATAICRYGYRDSLLTISLPRVEMNS